MTRLLSWSRGLSLLACLLLAACAGQLRNAGDTTGDLGAEKHESPAAIYVQMGIAYLREGQPAVALQKLKKAISIDPSNADAHNVIALLYERLGETQKAGEHFTRAVQLQPQDPYIRNARGSYYCKQGQYEKAQTEFEAALDNPLYPTPWVAMTNAGLCAERAGELDQAESYYRRALSANASYFQALYQMAELMLQQGDYLSARAYLERYESVAKATAGSLWLGVQIERKLDNRQRAQSYVRDLLDKFPDSPEVKELRHAGW